MRTAVRIFRKDVRHLWPVIAVVWAIQALSICLSRPGDLRGLFGGVFDAVVLAPLLFLVVLAVHDEALCDERQFWLTRPYSRGSLLAGKALFAFVFANLTVFVSDIVRCVLAGLPVGFELPHLLWRQICFTGWLVLGAAAVAAVTATLVQAVLTGLLFAMAAAAVTYFTANEYWGRLEWLQLSAMLTLLAATATAVIATQYKARRTAIARSLLGAGTLLALFAGLLTPLKPALALQSRLTGAAPAAEDVRLAFDPGRALPLFRELRQGHTILVFPFRVSGVPRGMKVSFDLARVRLRSGGEEWDSGWTRYISGSAELTGGPLAGAYPGLKRYERLAERPVEIRASVLLTLTETDSRRAVATRAGLVTLPGGEPCFVEDWFPQSPSVRCQAFDRYSVTVDARERETGRDVSGTRIFSVSSYGPDLVDFAPSPYSFGEYAFPKWAASEWDARSSSVRMRPFRSDSELIFTVERPAAHVIREFSASGVRLANYRAWE